MPGRVRTIVYLSLLLMAAPLMAAAGDQGLMRQGMAAFERGAYQEALQYFTRAEQAGYRSETLEYNIAVCLYRLQSFEKARSRFIKLSKIPKWRDLAHYNLGLVDEAAGRHADAEKWYRLAANAQSEKLRLLAGRKLAQQQASPAAVRNWMALLSYSLGWDSNAASLADEIQSAPGADDRYAEWLVYAQNYLSGRAGEGSRLYVLGFDRRHESFSSFDSQVMGLGWVKEFPWRDYGAETGVRLTQTRVDSELLAYQLQINLKISRPAAGGNFRLGYLPSRYFSGDRYSQIDGWQQRLEAGWTRRFDALTFDARYRFETNNRDDLRRDNSFSSYSPERNSIMAGLDRKLSDSLNLGFALEYTRSRYPDESRLRDTDGVIRQAARSNEQIRIAADLGYRWNKDWRVKGEYEYIDTEDSFDLYTYNKSRINASLEYQF